MKKQIYIISLSLFLIHCFQNTTLHKASEKGDIEEVTKLINNGTNINVINIFGETPLHKATYANKLEVAKLLIQNNANVNYDSVAGTPLHIASVLGYFDLVKLLILNKANINAKNVTGMSALHMACGAGHFEVVKFLVEQGAMIEAKDNEGKTPLHHASYFVVYTETKGKGEYKSNLEYSRKPSEESNLNGHLKIIEYLFIKGADINSKDSFGKTTLQYLQENGNKELANIFMKNGGKVK